MASKFKLEIELGNDAMERGRDIAEALYKVADKLETVYPDKKKDIEGRIFDANGNTVGSYRIA